MSDFTKPAEDLTQAAKEYLDLQVDDIKLRTARGLSVTLSKLLSLLVLIGVGAVLLLVLSFGLMLLLGEALGSYAGAALIVAGVLAVALVVLILLRNRLFQGSFVSLFVRLFFSDHDERPA